MRALSGASARRQHAAAGADQQLVRGQQRMQFVGIQPQAGQLEALGFLLVVAEAALAGRVALDRRAERVAQEGDVAVEGGPRTIQLIHQPRERHRITRHLQVAVQGEDAFVTVHARRFGCPGAARDCGLEWHRAPIAATPRRTRPCFDRTLALPARPRFCRPTPGPMAGRPAAPPSSRNLALKAFKATMFDLHQQAGHVHGRVPGAGPLSA